MPIYIYIYTVLHAYKLFDQQIYLVQYNDWQNTHDITMFMSSWLGRHNGFAHYTH